MQNQRVTDAAAFGGGATDAVTMSPLAKPRVTSVGRLPVPPVIR